MAHLRSVRLRGFKTFAKPTELMFEPGVTVIIGPNGSGKSNIADAVLWVLGEQSPGNLRGKSMQDVIFSGPDGRRSSAVAEVSLVFDNECGSLPLSCGEVEVTRRLERDGGSEYRVNGAACRLLDVQDLVGGLGLGREMHSVISQGKVEALLNSTPEARRALVEEAAGLGRFKKRRERAQSKLERTRQNLLRVSDVEREVKSALRPLKQQVAAAERFAEATEEWAGARARWLVLALVEAHGVQQGTQTELERLQTRRSSIEAELATLRRQKAAEEEDFSRVLQGREEMNSAYHRLRAETDRFEGRAVSLRQRVARIEGEIDRARRRRDLARSEVSALDERLTRVMKGTADEERLGLVIRLGADLRSRLEEALPEYRALGQREDDLKDAIFESEAARAKAVQDRDYLRREAEDRKRVSSGLVEQGRAAAARLERLRTEAEDLERRRRAAESALVEDRTALAGWARRRDEDRARSEEASREEVALAEVLTGIESRRSVLQELLERKDGIPAGVHELVTSVDGCRLLTEVLSVAPGYERALAAALGPLIQAVVMPGEPDPEVSLGTAGAVEAVWGSPSGEEDERSGSRGAAAASEKVPIGARALWEVVSGPEAVLRSLRKLVPPTAVVDDDGDLAITVSGLRPSRTGAWRLVTRDGEMVDRGVHAARRREAGSESLMRARNELAEADEEYETAAERREEARVAVGIAATTLKKSEEGLRAHENALRERERIVAGVRNEAELLARRIEEAAAQCEEIGDRRRTENDQVDEIQAALTTVERTMAGHDAQLEQARGGLRDLQARAESLRTTVARLEEKKAQASLLEVRLRERCRAQESERTRTRSQRQAAFDETSRYERRVDFLERYLPLLAGLLEVVDSLAGRARATTTGLEARVAEVRMRSEEAAKVIRDWGGAEAALQQEYEGMSGSMAHFQVESARAQDRRSMLEDELADLRRRHLKPRDVKPEDVAGEDPEALQAAVERAERRRERIGPVNPLAEHECAEMQDRLQFLSEQRRDLEASLAQLQDVIGELDEHIEGAFAKIFEAARENFSGVIATVFPGAKGVLRLTEGRARTRRSDGSDSNGSGEAEALDEGELEDDAQEEARGIALEVKLPNKAPRSMSLLSGGEKAMTAIAFLFSLFLARPCPFYILDEVEASLDDVNIRRFLSLVRRYKEKTQFIIITHQRQTMEVADTLYGVALESDGTSHLLSRRLGENVGRQAAGAASGGRPA